MGTALLLPCRKREHHHKWLWNEQERETATGKEETDTRLGDFCSIAQRQRADCVEQLQKVDNQTSVRAYGTTSGWVVVIE